MQELSFHIVDLIENSLNAKATEIKVEITEDSENKLFLFELTDNGFGIERHILKSISNPFTTTRTTRDVGLGLTLFTETVNECDGQLSIESEISNGTRVKARLKYDHINRDPLGDIADTIAILIISNQNVDFKYRHTTDRGIYEIDSGEIKKVLGDEVSLSNPKVVRFIRDELVEGLRSIGATSGYVFDEETELPISAKFLAKTYKQKWPP